jgi:hypothetical protein
VTGAGRARTERDVANRRQLDQTRAVKLEHEAPADHVPECAVGLAPVPSFTEELRKPSATGRGVAGDEVSDELDVSVCDRTATMPELYFSYFHGGEV